MVKSVLNTIYIYFKLQLLQKLNYRGFNLLNLVALNIPMFIFVTVFSGATRGELRNQVILYYALSLIVGRATSTDAVMKISKVIRNGDFSKYLLLPQNYLFGLAGEDMAVIFFDVISILPVSLLMLYIWDIRWDLTIQNILYSIPAIIIGFLIHYIIGNIVSLFTFFAENYWYTYSIYEFIRNILGGAFFPLYFFPLYFQNIASSSPFIYAMYTPIRILSNSLSISDIYKSIFFGLCWLIALYIIYYLFFKYLIKKFSAYGG